MSVVNLNLPFLRMTSSSPCLPIISALPLPIVWLANNIPFLCVLGGGSMHNHEPFPHHKFIPLTCPCQLPQSPTDWSSDLPSLYLTSSISSTCWRNYYSSLLKTTLRVSLVWGESTFKLDLGWNENFSNYCWCDLSWVAKPFRLSVLTLVERELRSLYLRYSF